MAAIISPTCSKIKVPKDLLRKEVEELIEEGNWRIEEGSWIIKGTDHNYR